MDNPASSIGGLIKMDIDALLDYLEKEIEGDDENENP